MMGVEPATSFAQVNVTRMCIAVNEWAQHSLGMYYELGTADCYERERAQCSLFTTNLKLQTRGGQYIVIIVYRDIKSP